MSVEFSLVLRETRQSSQKGILNVQSLPLLVKSHWRLFQLYIVQTMCSVVFFVLQLMHSLSLQHQL